MRIDTDDIERARGRKKVGRKHNHQARGRAREKQRMTPILRQRLIAKKMQRYGAAVAAYWRGELDGYPSKPVLKM